MNNLATLYEVSSKDKLLTSLNLAIDEARKVRAVMKQKNSLQKLEHVKKLVQLEREIEYLETTLFEIESGSETDEP
jgi:hypothetical protein